MLPRKTGGYSEIRPFLTSDRLAVGIAAVLVLGLFAALLGGGSLAFDKYQDSCAAKTWRNPVTGRIEAIGAGHTAGASAVPCR